MKYNYHTHSNFCDGTAPLKAYVEEAVKQHFDVLGFSGHAPLPFESGFAMSQSALTEYTDKVHTLGEENKDFLQVYLSLELDYIPGISYPFEEVRKACGLDYTIGSVHLVGSADTHGLWFIDGPQQAVYDEGLKQLFNNDIKKAVTAYYRQVQEMLVSQQPDIVGHFDKIKMHNQGRYFSEEASWYIALVEETLEIIAKHNIIVEVNTRGLYKKRSNSLFPDGWILKRMHQQGIGVMVNSDAHHPSELSLGYKQGQEALMQAGYKEYTIYSRGNWIEVSID